MLLKSYFVKIIFREREREIYFSCAQNVVFQNEDLQASRSQHQS